MSRTVHHIFFPKKLWQYCKNSNHLRTTFTIDISREDRDTLNTWIDSTIGYIPPIPPQELARVCKILDNEDNFGATLGSRLADLLFAIRIVASSSNNPTIKTTMKLTHDNLRKQIAYLESLGLIEAPAIHVKSVKKRTYSPSISASPPPTITVSSSTAQYLHNLLTTSRRRIKHQARHPDKHHLSNLCDEYCTVADALYSLEGTS